LQKLKDLVEKFINDTWNKTGHHLSTLAAKQCALIAVEEIIQTGSLEPQLKIHKLQNVAPQIHEVEYWFEVKKEIEYHV
jgi:hypothetical protein